MNISTKVAAGYGAIIVLLAIVGTVGIQAAYDSASNASNARDSLSALRTIKQYQLDAVSIAVDENSIAYDFSSQSDPSGDLQSLQKHIDASTADSQAVSKLQLAPEERNQLNAADSALHEYIGQSQQINQDFTKNTAASITSANNGVAALAFSKITTPLGKLVDLRVASQDKWVSSAASSANSRRTEVISVLIIAVIATIVLSIAIGRAIRKPLKRTVDVLDAVANGDLTQRLDVTRKDELGQMATALNTTLTTVDSVVAQIQSDADNLADLAAKVSAPELSAMADNLTAMTSIFQVTKS